MHSFRPNPCPLTDLTSVHTPDLVEFLRTAWDRWKASSYPVYPGQDRVVPYAFPLTDMTSGRTPRKPASVGALTGMFAMDTMTLIGPGTWEAAQDAAAAALTAAAMVASGSAAVYAAVRPPGHHAGTSFYGGACYLNNAALAAQRLVDRGSWPGRRGRPRRPPWQRDPADLLRDRSEVRYGSVHIDPAAGYFPHWLGFADESRRR